MLSRLIGKEIKSSTKSVLLMGPRQTGKSTLLSSLKPDLTINLARENEFLRYSADVDLFSEQIETGDYRTVFVDEIQRIPGLLNTVQAIIDESKPKRPIRFLLSGSSARKLRRGQANLLPGRVFSYQMGGLCARELDYEVNYARALQFGFLPEPYLEGAPADAKKLLESYASTYLKEEIQAEALARDLQGFSRFLVGIAALSGQILDFSKLANRTKVSRSSCVRFVEILEDTLIAHRVESFAGAGRADTVRRAKLYFFDVGVLNGLQGNFDSSTDRKGFLFEHLVYSQLRNSALAHDRRMEIRYFRTRHGVDVDFIVEFDGKTWAIEAKSGEASSGDIKSLLAFREYCPEVHRCVLVTPKEKKRVKDGVLICDWITLLKEMDL